MNSTIYGFLLDVFENHWTQFEKFACRITRMAAAVLTLALLMLLSSITFDSLFGKRRPPNDISDKIKILTNNLNSAAKSIGEIEQEIRLRQQLVEKLKSDAETARSLSEIRKDQAEAIAQALRGQLEQKEREGYWWMIGQNTFFAALGVAFSEIYRWIYRIRGRRNRYSTDTQ
jgi:hypothetical protein